MVEERVATMTIAEFVRLYDEEGPFEFFKGEIIELSPTVFGHNVVVKRVFLALHEHAESAQAGEAFSEMPFVLVDKADWVTGSRTPDVMFIEAARLAAYCQENPDWRGKPLMLVPDLAVEVVSPTDRYSGIQDKVEGYLDDGVRLVWVIDPQRRSVTTYRGNQHTALSAQDTLAGGDVLPGFEIKVSDLFE